MRNTRVGFVEIWRYKWVEIDEMACFYDFFI